MFGGLSVKGDSKEEAPAPAPPAPAAAPAASSGFSFLQSSIGATAAPSSSSVTSSDNAAATASSEPPQSQQPSASSSMLGSAFGFMSGGGGQEETTTTATAAEPAPPAPAASSMFAGLTTATSSVVKEETPVPSSPAAKPSMFAGLTTSSAPSREPAAAEPAAPPIGGSGFSFLSSAPTPAAAPTTASAPTESTTNMDAASTTSTAGSSFSFMNSMASSDNGETTKESGGEGAALELPAVKEKEEVPTASSSSGGGGLSGFSFLSGGAPPPSTSASTAPPPPPPATPVLDAVSPSAPPPSLIPSSPAPSITTTASTATNTTTTAPTPAPGGDLLSLSNASLPAGAGVSWSAPPIAGGAVKKVVKKKRGKRVGVGAAAGVGGAQQQQQPTSLPDPNAMGETGQGSSFQPPAVPGSGMPPPSPSHQPWGSSPVPPAPATPGGGTTSIQAATSPQSPPMRIKAERAMDKAEEFIREKQRKSAIALAAERAMQDRSGSGGGMQRSPSMESASSGGAWKMSNSTTPNERELQSSPTSPKDETYQAAKAAAEEAKKLASDPHHVGGSKGKHSLFGGFFHRNKSSGRSGSETGGSGHEISKYSSHGGVVSPVPTKTTFQRGGSSGSAGSAGVPGIGIVGAAASSNHGPPSPIKESLDIASYGSPRAADNEQPTSNGSPPNNRMELELEQQRQKQREAAAEAEQLRLQKLEELRKKEEQERIELQRIEAEKRRAPREKMQILLDHLADAARTSSDRVTQLREQRAKLVQQRIAAEKAERYATSQLKFAEAQQTVAAEEEDFEAADRLGTVIEEHAREREEQARICSGINDAINKLDAEKEEAAKAVAACFTEVYSKLQELEKEVDDRSKEEGVLKQFATTSKRLSSETERLANDLKHIERDEKVLEEEEKELGGQIGEETKEFEEKHKEASTKLQEVNGTIEELRKKLAEAEATAYELNTEISSYINSIQNVKSKYSRQLGRLEKKAKSVKESRADWTSEKESIEKAKNAHEAVVAAHSEEMVTREKLIEDIKAESSIAKDLEGIVSSAFSETDAEGATNAEAGGDDTDALDGEVLKYEAVVSEANQNVLAAETNIQNLEEELSSIEVQLPILEELKKTAASKRDFKAAGKASKEIKDSLARKEKCQAELAGEALERKQFAKEELQKATELLEEKKKIAAEKGREAGLKEMERLREKIVDLRSTLKNFASVTDSSSDSEDDAMNVSLVGAFVIESQICVLEAEGKALGEKYGGWEEVSSDDKAIEDSSVQSAPTFDSADEFPDIVIDKSVLETYVSLRDKMKELESEIENAAEKEDFEKAAELNERAQSVLKEFEAAGFASEKFELALKEYTASSDKEDTAGEDPPAERFIDEDVLEKYCSLNAIIQELEADIEKAVADEDFDAAAELEEKVQASRSDIESLGFSVDELEDALKNRTADEALSSPSVDGESDDVAEDDDQEGSDAVSADGNASENNKEENEEECTENMDDEKKASDVDDAKMNGESATEDGENAASDNTDADIDEDG